MITIIHGDDIGASRNKLYEILGKNDARFVSADSLTAEKLTLLMEPQSLLSDASPIVIEGFLSRRDSHEKKYLTKTILENKSADIVLWHNKKLTPSQINEFPGAKVLEFNLKPQVFAFLDSVGDKSSVSAFRLALNQEPVEKLAASLSSRLHLLLVALTDPNKLSAQGYYRQKILTQANAFGLKRLTKSIQSLVEVDYLLKSGNTLTTYEGLLDIYLSQI